MKQKRKLGRKLLSFLLTLAMVVGLMPGMSLTAYAEYVCPLCGSTNIVYNEEESEWFCHNCYMPFVDPAWREGSQNVCPHCGSTDYEQWGDDEYSCNSCGDWFVAPVEEVADDPSRIGSVYHAGDTLPKAFYYDDDDWEAVFLKQELAIYELRGCLVDVDVDAFIFPYKTNYCLYFRSYEAARTTDAVTAVKISSGGGSRENPYQLTPQYPVSFNANGGSPAPSAQQVWRGDKVTAPAAPTREGCEFAGWFNGNTQWDFNQNSVDYPITLTAHWNVPVTSVSLPDTATLTVDGEAVALTATVEPAEATDKTVKWSTTGAVTLYSDANCTAGNEIGTAATSTLTVYAKGTAAGSATVTVASNADSTKTASCEVTVNEAVPASPYAGLVNTTTVVKFNNHDWYIIADDSTATGGTVTLLAADTSFGLSKFHDSSNAYSTSTVKGVLDALTAEGGAFAAVKDAIADTDLNDVNVSGAKLYLLSTSEAGPYANFNFTGADSGGWWLRSPGSNGADYAVIVDGENVDVFDHGDKVDQEYGVRPALKLDLSKVTFDSASNTFAVSAASAHTHSFTYAAGTGDKANTITATCGEGCDITEGLTLTISAPTGDLTADGTKTFPATLSTGYNTTAFPEGSISEISYTKDGQPFTGTPTEAGAYVASVTVGDATASVSYTVGKSDSTAATVTANNRTYDETEQPLVTVTGEATGGTMQYALGTDDTTAPTDGWSEDIPTGTDAGTYYVWYKVVGDANHYDTDPACVTVTVAEPVKYQITWLNEDGSLIDTTQVESGATPTHAKPKKAGTAKYRYVFDGWTPEITEATADATYTATYHRILQKYTIKFVNDDGTVLQAKKVTYGTKPTYTGETPAKAADEQYTYIFKGWTPSIKKVKEAASYTATYIAVPYAFGPATFKLPAATISVGESAFEGLPMTIVEIPEGCESIGAKAFKDCTGLTQIRIPASVTFIDETAFVGCADVLVYGTSPSAAQTFCNTHDNCTFVAEN